MTEITVTLDLEDARRVVLALYAAMRSAPTVPVENQYRRIASRVELAIHEATKPEPEGEGDPPPPIVEKVAGMFERGSGV